MEKGGGESLIVERGEGVCARGCANDERERTVDVWNGVMERKTMHKGAMHLHTHTHVCELPRVIAHNPLPVGDFSSAPVF